MHGHEADGIAAAHNEAQVYSVVIADLIFFKNQGIPKIQFTPSRQWTC